MPSGKIHDEIWRVGLDYMLTGTIVIFPLIFIFGEVELFAIFFGYLIGSFIEPDLDQYAITTSEARLYKWFKDFGAFIVGYFTWYAYRFKHRGISHFPIIGTLTRWIWMLIPFMIYWIFSGNYDGFLILKSKWLIYMFIGNSISDLLHIGADRNWFVMKIFYKQVRKRKQKKYTINNPLEFLVLKIRKFKKNFKKRLNKRLRRV